MNKLSICCVVLFCLAAAPAVRAQIPDAGFETWSAGVPVGWTTDNSPGTDTVIWQTTDAHSGTYAVRGVAYSLPGAVISPALQLYQSWSTRPTTFSGYYKFSPTGGDSLIIAVAFGKSGNGVGFGVQRTATSAPSYTLFSIPISYVSPNTPDSIAILITIIPATGSFVHGGSAFEIDDLSLTGATGVANASEQTPRSYGLSQNFPNPFNPTTVINYSIPASGQTALTVYDLLGREVRTLVDEHQNAGNYSVSFDGSKLTSGVYFYRLQAGSFSQTKKLMLLK